MVVLPPNGAKNSGRLKQALDDVKGFWGNLPNLSAVAALIAGALALVGVTTDSLPALARDAPFALAAGVSVPVLLFMLSAALKPQGSRWGKISGFLVSVAVTFLIFMAAWVSAEATTPSLELTLTRQADAHAYSWTAKVAVDKMQSDEAAEVRVLRLERVENCSSRASGAMLWHEQAGAPATGKLNRSLAGEVVLTRTQAVCVVATLSGRCGWRIGVDVCVIGRPARSAFASTGQR